MWQSKWVILRALDTVTFPKIRTLRIYPTCFDSYAEKMLSIPDVYMPHAETLEICSCVEGDKVIWRLEMKQWDDLVLQLPVRSTWSFISVEWLTYNLWIDIEAVSYPGVCQDQFANREVSG